jgi:hypothetical protein
MAQLLKPQNVKIVTKDGEIVISLQLDININLNQLGVTNISENNSAVKPASKTEEFSSTKDENLEWVIPDFKKSEKVNFGK